jgi:hypothetical protein
MCDELDDGIASPLELPNKRMAITFLSNFPLWKNINFL